MKNPELCLGIFLLAKNIFTSFYNNISTKRKEYIMPVEKVTGAMSSLSSLTESKKMDKTILPGSLPRKKINFAELEYKTHKFNLSDSTRATLRVGYDTKNMISSLDCAYLNRIKHVAKDGGLDGDILRSFIRNIYEDSKSVIKNGIAFNKIQNSILEFLIKL